RPKLEAALAALDGGVRLVHMLDGTDADAVAAAVHALIAASGTAAAGAGGTPPRPGTRILQDREPSAGGAPAAPGTGGAPAPAPVAGGTPAPARIAGGAQGAAGWIERGRRVLMGNYGRLPLVLAAGRGAEIRDVDGRTWLDFVGGLAVNALGHGSEEIA